MPSWILVRKIERIYDLLISFHLEIININRMNLWYLDKSKISHISFLNLRYKRKVLIIIIFGYILYIRQDTNSPSRTNSFKIPFPYFLFPQHPNNGFPIVLGWSFGHFSLLSLFQRVHVVPRWFLHSPCHPWALCKRKLPINYWSA